MNNRFQVIVIYINFIKYYFLYLGYISWYIFLPDDHDIDIKHWKAYGRNVENIECYEIASGKVGMYDRTIYHNYLSSLQVSSSDFLYIVKLMIAVLYAHSAPVMSVNWEWWKLGNYNFFQVELVFPFYYYFCVCDIVSALWREFWQETQYTFTHDNVSWKFKIQSLRLFEN